MVVSQASFFLTVHLAFKKKKKARNWHMVHFHLLASLVANSLQTIAEIFYSTSQETE